MENRRYRNGNHQVRGNARRPFRHARRGKKIANSATVHYSLLPIRCPDSTPSVVLTYDAMGRQTQAIDAAGVTTFAYDSFGSLTNETVVGVAGTNTIERFSDSFGRDAGYALNGVRQSTLGYDPAIGRLATMLAAGSATPFAWNYLDGSDLKSSLTYPNGLTASWTYGNRGELLEVNNASPTGTISRYVYTYDAAGRRVGCDKSGSAFTTPDTYAYLYNARSELTNATAVVDAAYNYGYDFDDIGNRKTSVERGTNVTYAANDLNQYMSVDAFVPQYDADGNQTLVKTATGIWHVSYNGENRPVLWTQGTNTITMSYDRMGRRVTKNDRRFVYNGYLHISNFHSTTSNYNYFIWDPTEPVATRPLAWNSNGDFAHYVFDGNKNVSEVIAADGTLAAHYEYAPFGALTVSSGVSVATNPWRFSSEYAEDDTATVYYNYRHYEPVTGRWLQRDPIEEAEDPNIYVFCVNSVSKYVDILGLNKDCCCKLCLYSATPKKTFKDNKPIVVGPGTVFGHTWATKENCNSPDDQIVRNGMEYSFGPVERIALNLGRFKDGKLKGGAYNTSGYTPEKFIVVKKCWKLGQRECDKLKNDINGKKKYPKYFTPDVYCTTTATKFAQDHGANDIPNSNGPVKYGGETNTKPNPKTLAENMSNNGGIVIKPPKIRR